MITSWWIGCVVLAASGLITTSVSAQTTHNVQLISVNFVSVDANGNPDSNGEDITIAVGDTVHWEWVSGGFHNVESGIIVGGTGVPDGIFRSGDVTNTPGTTYDLVFGQAFLDANPVANNKYDYYCVVHTGVDMKGTVTVTATTTTTAECTTDADCDDGNVCTDDTCDASSGCSNINNDTNQCDDNDACTDSDACSNGTCVGTDNGSCCNVDTDCDDGDACTNDTCDVDTCSNTMIEGCTDSTDGMTGSGDGDGTGGSTDGTTNTDPMTSICGAVGTIPMFMLFAGLTLMRSRATRSTVSVKQKRMHSKQTNV